MNKYEFPYRADMITPKLHTIFILCVEAKYQFHSFSRLCFSLDVLADLVFCPFISFVFSD